MKKDTVITFKVNANTKRTFDERLKENGKTPSQWLRSVVEQYVKRSDRKVTQKDAK